MFEFFLQNSISSAAKDYKREHSFLNFEAVNKVLILFDIQNWNDIIPVIDDLIQNGKQVMAWTIQPKVPKGQSYHIKFPEYVRVIDPSSDVNWKKLLRPEIISDFDNLKYDTLLDLTLTDNDYLLFLMLKNASRFCVGLREREYKLYDFIILKEDDKSIEETYSEFKNYLDHIE